MLKPVDVLFAESGGTHLILNQKLALHASTRDAAGNVTPLHAEDTLPAHFYAAGGDLSGLTLYSSKSIRMVAENDITDTALYFQNVHADDISVVAAGRDIIPYDPTSPLRIAAGQSGNILNAPEGKVGPATGFATAGDIQVAGPGTLEVLAGRNLDLGNGNNPQLDGTAAGITSVGSIRNPALAQSGGANIVALAGAQSVYTSVASALGEMAGLVTTPLNFSGFVDQFLNPQTAGSEATRYLPVLGAAMGLTNSDDSQIWKVFGRLSAEQKDLLLLQVFSRVLRDAGRDRNDPTSPNFGTYQNGFAAILALFPKIPLPSAADLSAGSAKAAPAGPWTGYLAMPTKEIKTFEGGNVSILVPGGTVTVGRSTDPQRPDQGILTERGGAISLFAADSVNVGTSRIFTLRGGDEMVWSDWGDIAAGSGSKTVHSAPPTRVLFDPQSANVQNDLAGLATGSGIGVLATLVSVKPGDVDLIAPVGTIDAGDAGIRSSGNLNLAAHIVLNANNIQVSGTTAGTPPPPAAPNLGSLSAGSAASAVTSTTAAELTKQAAPPPVQAIVVPSIITVEVLGYGGGDEDSADDTSGA